MTSGPVTNFVFLRAPAGKEVKLEDALKLLARESRNEPGNIVYEVHQSASDNSEYFLYGIWRSKEDLEAHMKAAAIQAFLERDSKMTNGALNLRLFTLVDIVRM